MCNEAEEVHKDTWYLDTGCSNHMCGYKGLFIELDDAISSEENLA